jgi:DNA-binding IclR family transcriptional regulator
LAGISISAPTPRIVHAETGELGQLLFHHAAELSDALAHEAAPDQVRADAG